MFILMYVSSECLLGVFASWRQSRQHAWLRPLVDPREGCRATQQIIATYCHNGFGYGGMSSVFSFKAHGLKDPLNRAPNKPDIVINGKLLALSKGR